MKEGVKYVLERPPLEEELNPEENYLEEFDLWAKFKSSIEYLAFNNEVQPNEALLDEILYQQAVQFAIQEDDDSEDGGVWV